MEESPENTTTYLDPEKVMRIPKIYRGLGVGVLKGIDSQRVQAQKALTEGKSVTLYGTCGSGKTHLAVCLMRQWAACNQPTDPPRYVSVPDLMGELRETFGKESATEQGTLDEYIKRPLLLLDDLGGGRQTDYVCEALFRIIDARYRDESPTIITTNLNMKELAEQIDDRIASRLCGMGEVITLGDKDWRVR